MKKIIVIGGGASGVVSAIFAKNSNNHVIILERNNDLLKKLLITGNGKCNYYNDNQDISNYHSNNMDIVKQIITPNNLNKVVAFFDDLGIISKKKNGYYYPFSNQAVTIKNMLVKEVKDKEIDVCCNTLVTDIKKINNQFEVICDNNKFICDKLIISTGSYAYPKTGSTGMGYQFLKELGHTIIKPLPALVQLVSNGKYLKEWNGIRTDVRLSLYEDNKYISSEEGEIQLTDYGISGICTFNLSHYVTRGLDLGKKEVVKINFLPFVVDDCKEWLDNFSQKHHNKNIRELLECILNYKLVNVILKKCDISSNLYYYELDDNKKNNLLNNLFSFEIVITGTKSFDFAQIANGGVSLTEINPDTFESKLVSNLYIIGELLDINGNCGGYNLTIAWLSGILSGISLGEDND
jgi:hypothetical protein